MEHAKLSMKAVAFASAVLWGGAMFIVGLANLKWPAYGNAFLQLMDSVYPGYQAVTTLRAVVVGTGYALVDGAVGGFIFAWLYNLCVCCPGHKKT